jgi:hypothetical protein
MRLSAVMVVMLFALSCCCQTVPSTQGKALDGTDIAFPEDHGKPLVLMIGFSHKSSGDFDQWNKQALSAYLSDSHVDYYELTDLAGVPSFVNAMILHGMRRAIHGTEQSHFVPFYTDEDGWKKAVNYSASDNTYLVVADSAGKIVWQTHGVPSEEKIAELKSSVEKLTELKQ